MLVPVLLAGLTFLSTLFGGFLALRFRDKLHFVLAFAAGAVVATAMFEVLPEIVQLAAENHYDLRNLLVLSAGGFLMFHVFEKVLILREGKYHEDGHQHVGLLSASGFSIHSFFDGLGIGLGFLASFQLGLVIALAVLAHDFSDGLNTATVILRNKGNRYQAIWWLLVDATAPLLGVLASQFIPKSSNLIPFVLSFYFGFFLYLGASDLLPEAHHRHSSYLTIVATLLGFGVIYGLAGLLRGG